MFKSYSIRMKTVLVHQVEEGHRLFIGDLTTHMGEPLRHLQEAVGRPEEVRSPVQGQMRPVEGHDRLHRVRQLPFGQPNSHVL